LQDIRQTVEYASYMKTFGWSAVRTGQSCAFVKKLPLFPFSVIKILRHHTFLAQRQSSKLRKKYQAIIFKQEPFVVEKIIGNSVYFQVSPNNKWPLAPTKTTWINLRLSQNQWLEQMKSKTRYNLRQAQKNQLQIKVVGGDKITSRDLQDFYCLWSHNKPHNWLFRPCFSELKSLVSCFGKKCFFVLVWKLEIARSRQAQGEVGGNWKLIAGSLILQSSNMAFYWHNASTDTGKRLFAPTLCIWKAIREAKRQRLKVFDFEGIWDERFPQLNKGWKGFTKFKLGFVNS